MMSLVQRGVCRCMQSHSKPFTRNHILFNIRNVRQQSGSGLSPNHENSRFSKLIKPFAFATIVSVGSFGGAMIWQYETLRKYYQQRLYGQVNSQSFYGKAGSFRHHLNTWWNQLTPGHKLVAEIIAANIGIFLLWRIPRIEGFMMKYFASNPFSGAPCRSMLLSTFSQRSLIHLGCNMFVLWSFAAPVTQSMGREQFMAFFLTAGVISSFTSYIHKAAVLSIVPSIGASGAILGVLGAVCCQYPDARLSILFVDKIFPHSFSADTAMKGIVLFDVAGILLRWRLFDHAAHLGGMLFGILYSKYGSDLIWKQWREPVMKAWHDLRGKP